MQEAAMAQAVINGPGDETTASYYSHPTRRDFTSLSSLHVVYKNFFCGEANAKMSITLWSQWIIKDIMSC